MKISSERFVEIFLELVRISAVSKQEKPVAEYIRKFLTRLNVPVVEDHSGKIVQGSTGNLIAKIEGREREAARLAFTAHMDTVKPTDGIRPLVTDGVIKSDGRTILGADNRAGIAMILYSVENLIRQKIPHQTFEIIFTIGEETGLFGSANLDLEAVESRVAYILDSSADPGYFVYAAPGAIDFSIELLGKGSHAAVHPEQGINAVSMAGELITRFSVGRVNQDTTINLGRISGGEANNVVPPHTRISGEIRSFYPEQIDHYFSLLAEELKKIERKSGGNCKLSREDAFPGFVLDRDSEPFRRLADAMNVVGLTPNAIRYYGGSDANVLNNRGIRAIDLGIGAKNPHSTDEFIKISDMESVVKLVHQLVLAP